MISKKQREQWDAVWKRVEAVRAAPEGSAPLMPRKKKRPPLRPCAENRTEKA